MFTNVFVLLPGGTAEIVAGALRSTRNQLPRRALPTNTMHLLDPLYGGTTRLPFRSAALDTIDTLHPLAVEPSKINRLGASNGSSSVVERMLPTSQGVPEASRPIKLSSLCRQRSIVTIAVRAF